MHQIVARVIVQIYEIQTPAEARAMVRLGVDHIGSVITAPDRRHDRAVREAIAEVRRLGAVSSLIPLYTEPAMVLDTLAHHQPDIVHFCDQLNGSDDAAIGAALDLQAAVRRHYPDIRIMRSIPIGQPDAADGPAVLSLAARLEPASDLFLTDTLLGEPSNAQAGDQPVNGFVGITGLTCDWNVAAQLVDRCRIPVILAGGISPENVSAGIRKVRPYGVDSCTCTNAVDGNGQAIRFQKDRDRVKRLVVEAATAARSVSQ